MLLKGAKIISDPKKQQIQNIQSKKRFKGFLKNYFFSRHLASWHKAMVGKLQSADQMTKSSPPTIQCERCDKSKQRLFFFCPSSKREAPIHVVNTSAAFEQNQLLNPALQRKSLHTTDI